MEQMFPMTKKGYEDLEIELKHLKSVERPNIIKSIAEARGLGDLSENAEYHSAKERQGMIEARIQNLETKINCAQIIDVTSLSGNRVIFGASVTLIEEDSGKERSFQIVGSDEADVEKGLLSITSPLARTLLGKSEKESVEVNTPSGSMYYTVKKIAFEA